MPTYTYKCPNGHTKDFFHGMSEELSPVCEECPVGVDPANAHVGGVRMERVISSGIRASVRGGTPRFH